MMIPFFEQLIISLFVIFGTFGAGLATWYLKKQEECKKRIENSMDNIEKRTLRQSAALQDLSKNLDNFKDRVHSDEKNPSFFDDVDRKLRDEKGNL